MQLRTKHKIAFTWIQLFSLTRPLLIAPASLPLPASAMPSRSRSSASSAASSPKSTSSMDFLGFDVPKTPAAPSRPRTRSQPWSPRADDSSTGSKPAVAISFASPLLQLHEEILEFVKFLQPSEAEQAASDEALDRIVTTIEASLQGSEATVFGSRVTGTCLPWSDWDVMLDTSACRARHLQSVQAALTASEEAVRKARHCSFIEPIRRARVPILKLQDAATSLPLDISFNAPSGPAGTLELQRWFQMYPMAVPLVITLKHFLAQRGLAETYTGGVGSFLLSLMVLRAVQEAAQDVARMMAEAGGAPTRAEPATKPNKLASSNEDHAPSEPGLPLSSLNLGFLLLYFFELYGVKLNYVTTGVSLRHGGKFFSKSARGWQSPGAPGLLSVEVPFDPDNDAGKGSFSIHRAREAFRYAYNQLTAALQRSVPSRAAAAPAAGQKRSRAAAAKSACSDAAPLECCLAAVIFPDERLSARARDAEAAAKALAAAGAAAPEACDGLTSAAPSAGAKATAGATASGSPARADDIRAPIESNAGLDTDEEAAPTEVGGVQLRRPRLIHHILIRKHCRPEAQEAAMNQQGWY